MRSIVALLAFLVASHYGGVSRADEVRPGTVMSVQTRGVIVPIYAMWNKDAVATVVLYSGGPGGYGKIAADGWPSNRNFLIRSAKLFVAHPFNVVLVGRATDVPDLDGWARTSDNHDQDNRAVFREIKSKSVAPMWLVGTSMGAISVTAAAIRDEGKNIAGIVLTSSITSYSRAGAVPTQALEKIKVPVLVLHHAQDACRVCAPYEAKHIADGLINSPIKRTVLVDGGSGASGDPCRPLHYHGFIGMEKAAVDLIAAWIQNPAN